MKKVLFLLTTLALLMAFAVTASAATASASVTSSGSVHPGEEITFTVNISNATGIRGIAVIPDYDKSVFELVRGEWLKTGILTDFSVSTGDGVVAFDSATNVSGGVLKFTLKAKSSAAVGTYSVTCEVTLTDTNGNSNVSVTPASVKIACKHSFTTKSTEAKYLKSSANCTTAATYYYSCANCGEKGSTTFTSGSTTAHNYTKQDTASKYLKSAATCKAKALYYYSCTGCGEKGSSTFESGSVAAHSYTKKETAATYLKSEANCTTAATYYYCCATCTEKGSSTYTSGSALGHTGGTATCTAKAVCTRCKQAYGSVLAHTFTKTVESDAFFKEDASCTHGKIYYKSCVCGAKGTETFEVGSAVAHTYGTAWESDDNAHWHACTACGGKKDSGEHTWDGGTVTVEPTEERAGEKTYTCTVCGKSKTEALDPLPAVTTEETSADENTTTSEVTTAVHSDEKTNAPEPEVSADPDTNKAPSDEGGCGSMIDGSALLLMAMMLAPAGIALKKRL